MCLAIFIDTDQVWYLEYSEMLRDEVKIYPNPLIHASEIITG